jgi:hypothetical protein
VLIKRQAKKEIKLMAFMIVGFVSQQTYYHFKAIHNGFVLTDSCINQ